VGDLFAKLVVQMSDLVLVFKYMGIQPGQQPGGDQEKYDRAEIFLPLALKVIFIYFSGVKGQVFEQPQDALIGMGEVVPEIVKKFMKGETSDMCVLAAITTIFACEGVAAVGTSSIHPRWCLSLKSL
jgi:hypothetical protein